jgi:hypothetical protein
MPDIIGDGKERWDYVPSIASQAAPTTTEINAGIRLSQFMTKDGATGFQIDTADAPTSSLESTFDTATNGRRSLNNPRLRFKKQSGSDTVYDTLLPDTAAFLVRRKSITATTAAASAQKVSVFPIICSETSWLDQDDNMPERFDVPVKLTGQPTIRAAIA